MSQLCLLGVSQLLFPWPFYNQKGGGEAIAPSHAVILVISKHSPLTAGKGGHWKWPPRVAFRAERPRPSFLGRSVKFGSCGLVLSIVGLEDGESMRERDYVLRKEKQWPTNYPNWINWVSFGNKVFGGRWDLDAWVYEIREKCVKKQITTLPNAGFHMNRCNHHHQSSSMCALCPAFHQTELALGSLISNLGSRYRDARKATEHTGPACVAIHFLI